jgi:hypothetical protein
MNSFYEHHKASIDWHYRCFDRILLNGLIQPFQQPERVVGFFNTYRQVYPVTRYVLRDIAATPSIDRSRSKSLPSACRSGLGARSNGEKAQTICCPRALHACVYERRIAITI